MGGRFAWRKPKLAIEVAPGFERVERLGSGRRYSFLNRSNVFVSRVDWKYTARFRVRVAAYWCHPIAWAPDGREIFVAGEQGVFAVDLLTGAATELTPPQRGHEHQLSCSPDGRWLAHSRGELALLDLESGERRVLVAQKHRCLDVDWERGAVVIEVDDKQSAIDINSGEFRSAELRVVDYPNGRLWVRADRDEPIAFWSRRVQAGYHSGRIAHIVNDAELRIFGGDRDEPIAWFPGPQHSIKYFISRFNDVVWSPDGRFIAAVLLRLVRRAEMTELGRAHVEANSRIDWSPVMLEQFYFELADHALVLVNLEARQVAANQVAGVSFTFAPP